jgi:hypothetical protein
VTSVQKYLDSLSPLEVIQVLLFACAISTVNYYTYLSAEFDYFGYADSKYTVPVNMK